MMLRLLCLSLIHFSLFAAESDPHAKNAVKETQTLLRSKSEREKAIKGDKQAEDIDAKVKALSGSEKNQEDIYGLSADLMEKLAAEAKNDPEKMQSILQEAQANPQKFYEKYFSAEQKAKLRGIANEIEKKSEKTKP